MRRRGVSRRQFIKWLLAGGASAVAACVRTPPPPATPSPLPTLAPTVPAAPANSNIIAPPPPRLIAPPESGRITPIERFYVNTYSDLIPAVDLSSWGVQVAGLVERPLTLKWEDVVARPQIEAMRTLECIGNLAGGSLIGNATWQGISLRDLLREAGIKPGASFITFESQDEYYTTVPVERALDEQALLVHRMNGEPLKPNHGYPLRVLLTGVYGQKQPKWLSRIVATDQNELGTWEQQGWSNVAAIKVNSRIEAPAFDAQLRAGGRTLVAGMAFSGPSGIRRVDLSLDKGQTWIETTLVPAASSFENTAWTGWYTWWTPEQAGRFSIQARATDGDGAKQGDEQAQGILGGVFPDGTSAIHQIQVSVVA